MTSIKLEEPKNDHWHAPGHETNTIAYALPYYKSKMGHYYHRIRYAQKHIIDGKLQHISVGFWCGANGFIGEKGSLHSEIPSGGIFCATCAGRAVGVGLDGDKVIHGKQVNYLNKRKG